ncbi:hypothetical protein VTO73DRAFT_7289 [Trametes versicolor]
MRQDLPTAAANCHTLTRTTYTRSSLIGHMRLPVVRYGIQSRLIFSRFPLPLVTYSDKLPHLGSQLPDQRGSLDDPLIASAVRRHSARRASHAVRSRHARCCDEPEVVTTPARLARASTLRVAPYPSAGRLGPVWTSVLAIVDVRHAAASTPPTPSIRTRPFALQPCVREASMQWRITYGMYLSRVAPMNGPTHPARPWKIIGPV